MYKLKLNNLILDVYLGFYDFERKSSQKIALNLSIEYHKAPNACFTDNLNETICYSNINKIFTTTASKKKYKLIEHLAQSLLDVLKKEFFLYKINIYLEIFKRFPLNNLTSSSFYVEDICGM